MREIDLAASTGINLCPKVLEKFNRLVESVFDKIENLQTQTTKLRQMRDKLLPRLLSGKVPVEIAENAQ